MKKESGMNLIKRILLILLIISLILLTNFVYANSSSISKDLYPEVGIPLMFSYSEINLETKHVYYDDRGKRYPAYCMDQTLQGVSKENLYSVSVENQITDINLWRIIINGYPYKNLEQLGCLSEDEAYAATQHAIYCYLDNFDKDLYLGEGEKGKRALEAMKKIIENAQNCTETKHLNEITVSSEDKDWKEVGNDKKYLSKTYIVNSEVEVSSYNVLLENLPEGSKLINEKNEEKTEFKGTENFKILIPIEKIKEAGNFEIQVEAEVKTLPVYYGKAPNSKLQNYALTAMYEKATSKKQENYLQKVQEKKLPLTGM